MKIYFIKKELTIGKYVKAWNVIIELTTFNMFLRLNHLSWLVSLTVLNRSVVRMWSFLSIVGSSADLTLCVNSRRTMRKILFRSLYSISSCWLATTIECFTCKSTSGWLLVSIIYYSTIVWIACRRAGTSFMPSCFRVNMFFFQVCLFSKVLCIF